MHRPQHVGNNANRQRRIGTTHDCAAHSCRTTGNLANPTVQIGSTFGALPNIRYLYNEITLAGYSTTLKSATKMLASRNCLQRYPAHYIIIQ